jgi:hypothetical protein
MSAVSQRGWDRDIKECTHGQTVLHSNLAAGLPMVDRVASTGVLLRRFLWGRMRGFHDLLRQKSTSNTFPHLRYFFHPADGGDTFFRNVSL